MGCDILSEVRKRVKTQVMKYRRKKESTSALQTYITQALKFEPSEVGITPTEDIINECFDVLTKMGVVALNPEFFSRRNLTEIFTGVKQGLINTDKSEASADKILPKAQEELGVRMNVTSQFLDDAYGMVTDARTQALNEANQHIFDCLFVNRGSIDTKTGIVKNSLQRNRNIKAYQEQLLQKVVTYLNSIISSSTMRPKPEIKDALANPVLYKDGKNTGILETLETLINQYLSPDIFKSDTNPNDTTLGKLRSLYNKANDLSDSEHDAARMRLDAYNAIVLLKNFDRYLDVVLGDIIEIKDFDIKTGADDKYSISQKTSKLLTTWTDNEDRNVEAEADFITKLAIITTPLYYYGASTPREGKFLNFADYQSLIGKVKDLGFNEDAHSIKFSEMVKEGLHPDTITEINNLSTFSDLVNSIRRNPRYYLPIVIDIITNERFQKDYGSTLLKKFSKGEIAKLYSLKKGIFGMSGNSIYALSSVDADMDFFSFITQVADSIFNVQYLQYYRNENGIIGVRTFIDQSENNIRRAIENTINAANSSSTVTNKESFEKRYNIRELGKHAIAFTIPRTSYNVQVYPNGMVIIKDGDRNVTSLGDLYKVPAVQQFIDSKLRLGLYENPELQNALKEKIFSDAEKVRRLVGFAARVLGYQYNIAFYIDPNSTLDEQESKLKDIYGDNTPNVNKELGVMDSISTKDIDTLYLLAQAKAAAGGITTSTQAKDGEGNNQSLQTLSRLLGSQYSQFYLQESKNGAANQHALILQVDGLFEGVYTAKEYHDDMGDNKSFVDMCVSEMALSNFLYDYIGGLQPVDQDKEFIVGGGHILLLPSVNSDKGTIGRIRINLNKQVTFPDGTTKSLRECDHSELEEIIADQLGTTYINIYQKVQSDWNNLYNYISKNGFLDFKPLDYLNDFQEFNEWWEQKRATIGDNFTSVYGKTPADFIKYFTLQYNQNNRLHPLELIDQTHFQVKDKSLIVEGVATKIPKALSANQVLISQIARFKPGYLQTRGVNIDKYPTAQYFWNNKKKELLGSILKSRTQINTTNDESVEINYLKRKYPSWINDSGNVAFAKVKTTNKEGKPVVYKISASRDLIRFKYKYGDITDQEIIERIFNDYEVEIHPAVQTWNYLNYLFTQEYMNCTVGSFINHPEKSKDRSSLEELKLGKEPFQERVLRMEAAHFQAQHKRNVSFTAAMHAFQLNLLNGIPEEYNLAVIDDIKDEQGTINGLLNDIKPFDGATFVNPFVVILENNSLGGARAGISKKQFVHFKNAATGGGGIIKTAGFGLTNDWMRNSPFLQKMMQKMTDHVWLNEDGSPALVDITKDFKGNNINYGKQYYKQNGHVYEIVNILSNGNNRYQKQVREIAINENGDPKVGTYISGVITRQEEVINTNYKLWQFFGGMYSMSENRDILQYSNKSVEDVVKAMNNTASLDTNGNIITRKRKTPNEVKTQFDLWQPLKQVDVHYLATAGAVKQGAANINSRDKYTNDVAYDTQRIKMYQAGIQLDKEHHADGSELSLMTQVISACAAKGYTFEACSKLYNALRKSTEVGVKEHLDGVRQFLEEKNPNGIQEAMYEAIIHSLGTSNTSNGTNFAQLVAQDLIRQAKEGKKINYSEAMLPLSDNTVFRKIFSTVSSYLTNTGIKQSIPGILSVLTPSHNIMQLVNNKKYESYSDKITNYSWVPGQTNFLGLQITPVNPGELISPTDGAPVAMRNLHDGRILMDEALMLEKFNQKAWKTMRNSRPLNYEFNSYEEWVNFALLHEAMHDIYHIQQGESRFDYESRINEEAIKRLTTGVYTIEQQLYEDQKVYDSNPVFDATNPNTNISDLELGRTYKVTRNVLTQDEITGETKIVPITKYELIRTPLEYKRLKENLLEDSKETLEKGQVISVVEAVYNTVTDTPIGRDLAAYNVRFTTADGNNFQLWDLDSAVALFRINNEKLSDTELTKIAQDLFPGQNIPLDKLKTYVSRMLQKDLQNLSSTTPDALQQYNELLASREIFSGVNQQPIVKVEQHQGYWTRDEVARQQDKVFLFGDNTEDRTITKHVPTSTQAVIRGLPNAIGIDTKKNRGTSESSYFTDTDFEQFRAQVDAAINQALSSGKTIVIPADGIGTGKAELATRAPKLFQYLQNKLASLQNSSADTSQSNWYDRYAQWVNIYLGTGNGSEVEVPNYVLYDGIDSTSVRTSVNAENFDKIQKYFAQQVANTTFVRIGNQTHKVDKTTVKVQPYELIMPKTFATNFGLKEFDSLSDIEGNPYWFVEQYIKNQEVTVNSANYSLVLKTSTGDHTYLLSKEQLQSNEHFKKVPDTAIGKIYTDGKILRVDSKGNPIYEITEDFELYLDDQGHEVIVTDNLEFYINNTSCESIELSSALQSNHKLFRKILNSLKDSKGNKIAQRFYGYINNRNNRDNLDLIYQSSVDYNQLPNPGDPEYDSHRIIRSLKEKHTSFLKSLDVVAARIPAQSMQSFMPMRVVAFDNPDINTAYVSTMQILLQGSDSTCSPSKIV